MHNRLLRPLLIIEFLLALQVIFTVWSEVGGQYHLDLMFWAWKLGLSFAAAALIVAITAIVAQNQGAITRQALMLCSFLIAILALAGMVTYYYHLYEPTDQNDQQDEESSQISRMGYHTRQAFPARTIGKPSLQPKAF